jgi:hypothetical protein
MASLLDMRRRIKSVKNTQQITKAMKMVAAAKAQTRAGPRDGGAPVRAENVAGSRRFERAHRRRFFASAARRARR